MFVFISDVWLDQAEVLEKLHTMFSGRFHFLISLTVIGGSRFKIKFLKKTR